MNNGVFQEYFRQVPSIRMREPLAEMLGAFKREEAILEYSFADVVKIAGHACPTMAGAYLCCQAALEKLFNGETPVRGEISVTVHGQVDEGVYGVIGQAVGFITGAAPSSGFRGLGPRFKRKDLLRFGGAKIDPEGMCFEFRRLDGQGSVLVTFYPQRVPFPQDRGRRLSELLEKVLWDAAKEEERDEFQKLWTERIKMMLLEKKDIHEWLTVEARSE